MACFSSTISGVPAGRLKDWNHLNLLSLTCLLVDAAVGQNTYTWLLLVAWASSQYGSWVPTRSSLLRKGEGERAQKPGRRHGGFYDLALEVTQHLFWPILLIDIGKSTLVPHLSIEDCHCHSVKRACMM